MTNIVNGRSEAAQVLWVLWTCYKSRSKELISYRDEVLWEQLPAYVLNNDENNKRHENV